jgi:Cu2+-containing amine oxidase
MAGHPLDLLSPVEIERAVSVCKQHSAQLGLPPLRFNSIVPQEPVKYDILLFEAGKGPWPPRRLLCIVLAPPNQFIIEAVVDLEEADASKDSIISWHQVAIRNAVL